MQASGFVVKSPIASCFQNDSLTIWARTTSSSMPHLHAVHWMISSVVPVKSPVTRGYAVFEPFPGVELAAAFSGRFSRHRADMRRTGGVGRQRGADREQFEPAVAATGNGGRRSSGPSAVASAAWW